MDVSLAGALLIAVGPLLLVIAAAIRCLMGTPVLFAQRRAGLHGRCFTLYKFRTMRAGRGHESDQARLTRLGRLLRATSLDELPQLWHVLRGEMSLVGPRPLLPRYLVRYSREQARRHEVQPGITGLAQVSGRNTLTWEERLALDARYVDNRSMRLDLWILWQTLVTVLRRDGVSARGHATMPEFLGSTGPDGTSI